MSDDTNITKAEYDSLYKRLKELEEGIELVEKKLDVLEGR